MKKVIILFCIVLFIIMPIIYVNSAEEVNITITSKERITTGSGSSISSKYLVFTEKEVFENTDTILFGKWNSSDLQNKIKINKTYKVKVAGWRIPFLSSYRNIIKIN